MRYVKKFRYSVAMYAILSTFFSCGAAVSVAPQTESESQHQLTLDLMQAIRKGEGLEVIQGLIRRGADVNASYVNETTPLRFACYCQRADVVHYLLSQGARASVYQGYTILSCASSGEIAKILLERKEDANGRSIVVERKEPAHGRLPVLGDGKQHYVSELMMAVKEMHEYEKIKLLLEYGARIYDQDKKSPCGYQRPIHGCVVKARELLQRSFALTTMPIRRSTQTIQNKARLDKQLKDIIPVICLLVCNGAFIEQETLHVLGAWIKENTLALQYLQTLTQSRSSLMLTQQTLLEIKEILLNVSQNNAKNSIFSQTLSKLDLIKDSVREGGAVSKVVDPRSLEHRRGTNVFKLLMHRQAGSAQRKKIQHTELLEVEELALTRLLSSDFVDEESKALLPSRIPMHNSCVAELSEGAGSTTEFKEGPH